MRTRDAYCADELNRPVGDEKCNQDDKIIQERCELQNCPNWTYSEWSAVSFFVCFSFL